MNKTREQWQKVDARHCAEHNSNAANFYLIRDAQQDIERLHAEVETLRKRARTAEQELCEECGGNGSGGDHEDDCSKAPSLPSAGSADQIVTDTMIDRAMNAPIPGGSQAWVWLFNCEGGRQPEEKHKDFFRRVLTAALSAQGEGERT